MLSPVDCAQLVASQRKLQIRAARPTDVHFVHLDLVNPRPSRLSVRIGWGEEYGIAGFLESFKGQPYEGPHEGPVNAA